MIWRPVYVVLVPGGVALETGGHCQVPGAECERQGGEGEDQSQSCKNQCSELKFVYLFKSNVSSQVNWNTISLSQACYVNPNIFPTLWPRKVGGGNTFASPEWRPHWWSRALAVHVCVCTRHALSILSPKSAKCIDGIFWYGSFKSRRDKNCCCNSHLLLK